MNIFVLDEDPIQAAFSQCNKHVVKMVTETAQLLCSVYPIGVAPYKRTHYNHPCAVWARTSLENYLWLLEHGGALGIEYTARYQKLHAASEKIKWCHANLHTLQFPQESFTPHVQCMPDQYKAADAVTAYRQYYLGEKAAFAKWPDGKIPSWWSKTS